MTIWGPGTSSKNEKKKENNPVGWGPGKISQEGLSKKQESILLSAPMVENGKLTLDKDKVAQSRGFINAADESVYKYNHPAQYEASGGVKLIKPNTNMSGAPFANDYDYDYALNLSNAALSKIENRSRNADTSEIDGIIKDLSSGEWRDADTMKKYSDTVNTYVNDYIALNELGHYDHLPENERTEYINSLKSLKEYVNSSKEVFVTLGSEIKYNNLKDVIFLPWDEQQQIVRDYRSASTLFDEIDQNIEDALYNIKNSPQPERTENVDECVDFFVKWHEEKGSFNGARQAYGISKGYTTPSGKYDKGKENSSFLIDQAERKAKLVVEFGDKDYVEKRNEMLQEYWENSNTSKEFSKYYTEMNKDPSATKYIQNGKKIYKTKNKNISNEEYDVACYYLGKGEKNNYYFTWLEDVVYKREVAASKGWSAVTDGESLKYHRLWSDYTKDAPLEANVMSVAMNLGAGAEFAYNTINGEVKESKLSKASSKIREAHSNIHDWNVLGFDVYDFLYNTTMSGVDSLAAMSFGNAGSYILGLSAAAAGVNDALNRGMSEGQAFWNGFMSGVFECFFEKYSIEQFESLKSSKGAGFKTLIKNLGKTMLTNASEETLTEVANIAYDTIFNGDLSNYKLTMQQYLDSGLSKKEANRKAALQLATQVVEAAASGALMGFGFGSVGSVPASINAAVYGKYYYGFSQKSIYALVENGLAMPEGSNAYKLAAKADSKINGGKNLSGSELYNLATAIESEIETKSTSRLSELGVDKKTAKELSPVVAKAVFGERLTVAERSVLNNSEIAAQVVKELSADRANTVWKDAVKNNRINNTTDSNSVTEPSDVLQSTANGLVDNVTDGLIADEGDGLPRQSVPRNDSEMSGTATGVVQGTDGKQYFDDGSGDEYFGDDAGVDAAHGGDTSIQGEAVDGGSFDLTEPTQKDIARAPSAEEAIEEAITGKQKTNIQRHIVDICKKLFPNITVEFVDKLEGNGKFIRSQNKILIKSNLNAVQMYVEVFKHEFMHRLETKQLYSKFFNYCFNKSKAFEQYVRAELKSAGMDYNVDTATREGVLQDYIDYKYEQYKNDEDIPQKDRDAFTKENAREEIIADFFAQILFQGKQYRARIIEALENADGEALIGIGDEVSSEAALMELQEKEPTLFEQVVKWFKDVINKLRGMPQAKSLVDQLDNEINQLESMVHRVYQSKDSKRLMKEKLTDEKYSYAGPKSKTHNFSLLEQAIRLDDIGKATSEEIRQQTGWFRGYDGKWRYEIDDSKMKLIATEQAVERFKYLILDEVIEHNELFDAYPELRYTTVAFKDPLSFKDGEKGVYISSQGTIFVRNDLKNDELIDTLIHEIQHNIQHIEGFASGSSPSYWQRKLDGGFDSRTQAAKEDYNDVMTQYNFVKENDAEFFNDITSLMETKPAVSRGKFDFETFEKIEEDPIEWKNFDAERDRLCLKYGDVKVFKFMDVVEKVQNNKSKGARSATDLYWYTAGEIEARDSTSRRNMTAEQRENTRPDIDRQDVVFASSSEASWQSAKDAKYDSEIASISQQIKNSQAILNKMDIVGEATVPEKIKSKYDAAQWAISQLKSFGYQVDRQNFGKIYFDEKDIRHGAEYADTYVEKGAFVLIPKVLKRGVEIGHHGDHKLRQKETVTFAAPVMLNGIRGNMAVVVNLNGNRYLVHRIILPDGTVFKFSKKNKEVRQESYQGVTENSSLADTTSLTSKDSIPNFAENVNNEKSNDNSNDTPSGQHSLGSPLQQMRYNPEAYAKHLNRKYQSKVDNDAVAKKIKQIVAQDNKSQKAQEETRQKVYDREGNLVGELTRQVAEAAASGTLMGFGFGGIGSVSSHINAKAVESAYSKADINGLINKGLSAPDSKAYALAQQAQSKTNSGKSLSAQEIVDLQQAVTEVVSDADISKIKQAVEIRLIELGEGKAASAVADIITKQVVGQKLTSSEKSTLKSSKYGQRVVNEMSPENVASGEYTSEWAENIGTDIINQNVYNRNLQSGADGVVEQQGGQDVSSAEVGEVWKNPDGTAPGVVQGSDGRQYFDDGSGDEYFGDTAGVDAAHGGDVPVQGEAVDGGSFDLTEPTQKDIARAPSAEEAIEEAITGKIKTNIQRHITDICKKLFPNITVEFSNDIEGNGKFIRSQNKILIRSNLSAVQMYVEVFKHEFMHRLETKQLYSKFFNYCFNKSKSFEQYVRAVLKSAGVDFDAATREGVLEAYTKYKYNQYKNSKDIPKTDRDKFTMENAKEEIIADFFAQILFQGKQYRARIIEALQNADGEMLIGIGDKISSEAALMELQEKEPTLFEQVVKWFRDIIDKLRGMPQAKSVVSDLENELNYLEHLARKTYQSKDSKQLVQDKQNEDKYDIAVLENGSIYVIASRKVITGNTLSEKRKDITNFFKRLLKSKSHINIPTIEGDVLTITMGETADKARDNYRYVNKKRVKMSNTEFAVKLNVEAHIDEIAEVSIADKKPMVSDDKNHSFAKSGFKYRTAYFEDFDGKYYKIRFSVGQNGEVATIYNVGKIEESVPSSAKIIAVVGSLALDGPLSNNIIFDFDNKVKRDNDSISNSPSVKYSLDSPIQNHKYDNGFNLSEPDTEQIEISEETEFLVGLTDKNFSKLQKHIIDVARKLNYNNTIEFVDKLEGNGKFIRSQNKILIKSNLNAVQMYVEVFKHEFMHRLETKQLYSKFFNYCFNKSKAFEQYVRAELKSAGMDYNVDTATREGVLEAYTKYKFEQYKNSKDIPKTDRDKFTIENAQQEIIADFFAQILFQGKQYRARIIEALENADGETLIGIGDEVSSEAALIELQEKEPTLFEQVVKWFKDVINKLRGLPQAKSLVDQLDNEINQLESMVRKAYQSKDSKRLMNEKLADGSENKHLVNKQKPKNNTGGYKEFDKPITVDDVAVLRSIGKKSINNFSSEDIEKAEKWAYKFHRELGVKSPFFRAWFGDWRAYDNKEVDIVDTKSDNRSEVKNIDTGWNILCSRKVYKETSNQSGSTQKNAVKYLKYIDDITKKAVLLDSVVSNKDNQNSLMFHSMYAYTEVLGYPALLKLRVEELYSYSDSGSEILKRDYILQSIEEESVSESNRLSKPNQTETNSSKISISNLFELVKKYDKNFKPVSVNKEMLNSDGTPKLLFHQTEGDFNEFDTKRKGAGASDNETPYGVFLKESDRDIGLKGKKQMALYARMINPLVVLDRAQLVQKAKELSPVVAKAVFGERLTVAERSVLNNSEIAAQVVKELSADRANTVWKDAIKNSRINNVTDNNVETDQGEALQSGADGVVEQQGGQDVSSAEVGEVWKNPDGTAPGVVQGADGRQYFDDGSGDECFGDPAGVDVAHGGDASVQGEAVDGGLFDLTEPTQKEIARAPSAEEAIEEAITGKQKTNIQRHIVDICKKLFPNITVEFVDGLKSNCKFIRSQNKILIRSDLSAVQMYIEVFKHEFMHRLETKQLYSKFFNYCFNKSKAFEQYVRAELKSAGMDYNVDTATREGVLEVYTKYKFEQYKNSKDIPQKDRDAFTKENAREEIIADFFAQILFQGKQYRARIIEALQNADGEMLIGIGDKISSEAALMELQEKEPTLFEQVVQWFKDIINKLRSMPQAKSLVEQLDNEINLLESMVRKAYQSKDSKRLMKEKLADEKYSYAGPKSKTHSFSLLEQAIRLEDVGKVTSEEIRQQTGWFRGFDGKWRYEISDRDMEIDTRGKFHSNPDIRRYTELVDKVYFEDAASEAEIQELNTLQKNLEGVSAEPKTLGELIKHDKLFAAYPQLKDIKVRFESINERGIYDPIFKEIFLNKRLKLDKTKLSKTLIHEIQHAIQDIEGFAGGSNLEYWQDIGISEEKAREYYEKTAGEIEARDAASRYWRTDEARKETRPDIDRQDVVFAGEGVSYSTSTDYSSQVDKVLENTHDKNNHIYMGNTPQKIVDILGIKQLPMLVTNKHIYSMSVSEEHAKTEGRYDKNYNYHDLGDIVKEIPKLLNNPIMIIKSTTKVDDARFVVVTNAVKDNSPVVIAIKPNGKGFFYNIELDSNVVLSAYGKDGFDNYINTAYVQDRILYVNKNSQRQNIPGVQFPNNIMSTDYNNNLARFKQIVNTKFMQKNSKYEKSNDNSNDTPSGQYSLGSPIQQMRYNPEAYAKHLNRKYQSKADNDAVAKKIKQIVAQDNKSQKAQEETRRKVYDREGNLVGELTLKERLINEVAVEIAESIAAPRTAQADEVISHLKEKPLVVNEKQEAEIKNQYGTLTNFRKDTGIRVVSENSEVAAGLTTLETAWNGDWVSEYPDLFKSDVNDLDMPIRLAEIVDNLNGMTEEIDEQAVAADIADNLSRTLNETGPKAEKRRVNEAYRKGVADEHAKNAKQIKDLQKQNRNLKNRVKPKDVQNIRKEVERIYKKLAANSSTKHVHQGLKKSLSEFLELFNQSDEFTFKPEDRAKVTRLRREYSKLADTDGNSEAFGYDANIDNKFLYYYNDYYDSHYGETLYDTPQNFQPSNDREWRTFCRSFANKTSGIQKGEHRMISIFTADNYYIIDANGYMCGKIMIKETISDNMEKEKFLDDYTSAKIFGGHDDRYGSGQRNGNDGNDTFAGGIPDTFNVELDAFIESHPEWFANKRETYADYKRRIKATSKDEVAFSMPRDYSYEALINKPDMIVTMLDDDIPNNRVDLVTAAKKNAVAIGKAKKDGSISVYVDDIGKEIVIGKNGLVHGLDRRFSENAKVTLKAGEIIKNSIKINELTPAKQEADESYVLIGAAIDTDGKPNVVRFVVNRFSNELLSMDVLYAINTKKESTAVLNAPLASTPDYRTTISISKLLDYVNKYFPDILPESVLRHYGYEVRPEGKIGESALFSIPIGKRERKVANNIIELSKDNELSKRIGDLHGNAKYKIIQQYILDVLSGEQIKLSDGKVAVVDKSDALHIANKAANKKTAQISSIREIVEKAILVAEEESTKERKFDYFYYYEATVKYDGEKFNVYLDVGRARNNGTYHIYDITNKIRDTANRINGLERPKPNEGYALTNGISTNSISDNSNFVNVKENQDTDNIEYEALNTQERNYIKKIGDKFGVRVVFEDLREMIYKGEIISPDGYIDAANVIHMNTYAENPIGFVFKHELAHYAEKSSGYKDFVKVVKNSSLYDEWIKSKANKEYSWEAEETYRQIVFESQRDFKSLDDPRIENEIIADFVGDMLFTDNGSGLLSYTAELKPKQRNVVVQWVIDFIAYLKKRISGNNAMTFELSKLEDRFNELLSKAKYTEYVGEADDNIRFSFSGSKDGERLYNTPNKFKPVNEQEWSVFNRQFSNKTSHLKYGEQKNIIIYTESDIYFIDASGYMIGRIDYKMHIDDNQKIISKMIKEYLDGNIAIGKISDSSVERTRSELRRSDRDIVSTKGRDGQSQNIDLDARQPTSDDVGYNWENYGYDTWEELIDAISSGAIIMDENGEVLSINNKKNEATSNKEVAFSMSRDYSYEALINKPDIKITEIDSFNGQINNDTRKDIVDKAVENAAMIGKRNDNGNAVIYVKDIDTEIILSKSGLRHGIDRRLELLAPVLLKSGEILKNSIRVNELIPRVDNISKSYVLIGVAKNAKNEPYIISFVVNKVTSEVSAVDVLYAINAKKESAGLVDPSVPAKKADYFTDSTISISKLLDYVNKYFPDILPESVLRHYGYEVRPEGKIGESALFSIPIGKRERKVANNIIELSKDNDQSYHLYDITQKLRDTAHRVNDVGRPPKNEGDALKNGISTDSISDNSNFVNVKENQDTVNIKYEAINTQERNYIQKIGDKLGVRVVFEDLREMAYKGEIISPDGYIDADDVIHMNTYAENPIGFVFKHELAHYAEKSSGYKDFVNAVKSSSLYDEWIKSNANKEYSWEAEEAYRQKVYESQNNFESIYDNKIDREIIADFVGDMLFTDNGSGLLSLTAELKPKQRNVVVQWVIDFIAYLKKRISGNNAMTFELSKLEDRFNELLSDSRQTEYVSEDNSIRFSLRIKHTDGMVEELADARDLTDEQAVEYLNQAKKGVLKWNSYIPVRKDTPSTIIETLKAADMVVENRSLVMQVRKAQQAMSATNNGAKSKKHGNNMRSHAMSAEQIVEIVNNLDNPAAVILQTNRYNQYGEELPDNIAVFVEYNDSGKEGVAIVEFDSSIAPEFIGKEFGDTNYHTVVTIFEPDTQRGGMPFDYMEELLLNPDNYELEIVRRQPARSVIGKKRPNTSSEPPSNFSISNTNKNVKDDSIGLTFNLKDRFSESLSGVEHTEYVGATDDNIRFSIKQNFYTQLDNWDKQTIGFSFVVGKTSNALLRSGVPNKQIRWDASKIKTLLNKHNGMTIDIIRQIPELLENPVVIIDSKQNQNSRIAIGELKDNNGKLVTVVLLLTPSSKIGNQLDVIKISSAQGRGHIESLFKNDDGSLIKIWYVDKNRIQSWLNVNRLQLPLHSFNLDSIDIISNTNKNVKDDSVSLTHDSKDGFNELLSKEEHTEYVGEADDNISFSFNNNPTESGVIINLIKNNIEKISDSNIFAIEYEKIPENITKSSYVFNIFKKQGEMAYNEHIGNIEMTKSGAKSTVFHGFGKNKLAATSAIKTVIEQGNIISSSNNYNETGVDRYVIAAKGLINNQPAYIGVVVKAYPNIKNSNAKFYLHEALIIETDSPIMTVPQLSVDTVSESISKKIINKRGLSVKRNTMNFTDNIEYEALNTQERNYIKKIGDKLGVRVVFEDLREMIYKGEIISPDGYIDVANVIHMNTYAENPIGFVFKHELAHYAEKSSGYKDFVKVVKNSSLYDEWIKSKANKEYSWEAEETYRQIVFESQRDFKSLDDPRIENEIIADFVGDMLFTDNGSGLLSLTAELKPKQRNVVVQWVIDFINNIKRLLTGQKNYLMLELSVLEDNFRCLLDETIKNEQNSTEIDRNIDEVQFCFIRCTDDEVIHAAEEMEKSGAKQYQIWDKLKVIRNGWGDWLSEVDIKKFAFFARGNAALESGSVNPKIKLDGDIIEGKLEDFIRFKSLFKIYPQLKKVPVVIKYATMDYDTVKYLIASNKLIIDKKLYDSFVNENNHDIKAHIIREIQRMIQVVEERTIDSGLKNIERIREKGFPMSLTEDRMLTDKEISDNFADVYEARVAGERQAVKNMAHQNHRKSIYRVEDMLLYAPHFNYDQMLVFDDNNNLVTAKEYDILSGNHKLDNYPSLIYDSKIDPHTLVKAEDYIQPYEISAEDEQELQRKNAAENSKKMVHFLLDMSYQKRTRRIKPDNRTRAGNSGYFENKDQNVKQLYQYIISQIYANTDVEPSGEDTEGRKLHNSLIRQIADTKFKDKHGNILSFYIWNNTPVNIQNVIKFGMEFTTFDGVLNEFLKEKQIRPYRYNGMFQEFYLNSVSPLVLKMNGWNTIDIAKRLLNDNMITQTYFDSLMRRKTATQTNFNNGTVKLLLEKIIFLGYDSVVFVKDSGVCSVMVFEEQQIIPVAQKGIICNEKITQNDDNVEYEKEICNVKFVSINEQGKDSIDINKTKNILAHCDNNTQKLIKLTEILTGANKDDHPIAESAVVGSSGVAENTGGGKWEILSKYKLLKTRANIPVADYDVAQREVSNTTKQNNANTIFKDNNGRLLSLFAYKGRYLHDQFGVQLGTLNAARHIYNSEKEKHPQMIDNNFLEYYVNMTNPYFFTSNGQDITPANLAKSLFAEDKISFDEYSQLLATNGCKTTSAKSPAAAYLRRVMWKHGIDGVIYTDQKYDVGSMGVIAIYPKQLTLVSQNGKAVNNDILNEADANGSAFFMDKNNVETGKNELLDDVKDSEYNKIKKIKCRNEKLAGKKHVVTGVPFERVQTYVGERIIEVVVPRFNSLLDAQLPEEMYMVPNERQFKECYRQLREALKDNAELRKYFTSEQCKALENGEELDGYTWHHDVAVGRMQLVDMDIHLKTGHTGGQYFWGGGTQNR